MSRTIDDRVVSMEFDNRQFENNVKTSLGTLDKLKQSLNFTGASKGLESVNAAAKNCNLSPLGNGVDSLRLKFSSLEVMAVTALSNITNSAVNAGKRLLRAFTIDPVKTGLSEYETQIGAIQTILANTEKEGATLDRVNAALDELNTYADKTIYNFTEMTRNIGTFTAAGVDLDTSVNAIKGIANLAAISGSSSQQASTAMYQLSQAMASGTVKLMDWNSVVNAGMGGQVFQDALKETARVHGINIDKMIKKHGSFRETLQTGWLTTDILTETLMKFTLTTEGLTDAEIERNREMLRGLGYTEQQIDEIFQLGNTATDAATKVKTFTQLLDTLKESVQSGWAQTWELIFGDFEEAKEFWTNVSNIFGGFIEKSSKSRNDLLGGALTSNWDKMVKRINDAGVETSVFEEHVRRLALEKGFNVDNMIEQYGSLENVFKNGVLSTDLLREALYDLDKTVADLSGIDRILKRGSKGDDVKQVQQALKDLGYDLGEKDVDGIIGKDTVAAIKAFQKANGLKVTGIIDEKTLATLKEATKCTNNLLYNCQNLIDGVDELGGRELLIQSLKNVFEGLMSVLTPIKKAFTNIFPPVTSEQLYKIIEGIEKFTSKLKLNEDQQKKLERTFKGLFAIIDIIANAIGGGLKVAFKVFTKLLGAADVDILTLTANIGDAIVGFRDWLLSGNRLVKGFEKVIDVVAKFAVKVYDFIKAFFGLPEVQNAITNFKNEFKKLKDVLKGRFTNAIDSFKAFIGRVKELDSISLENIVGVFKDFWKNIVGAFFKTDTGTIFDGFIASIKNIKDKVVTYLEEAGLNISEFWSKLKNFVTNLKNNVKENIGGILALTTLLSFFLILKKLTKAFELIRKPIDFIEGLGDTINKFGDSLALATKATAVKNIAIAIAILAGSLAVLAMLPVGKLWSAVGAMVVVAGVLVGMIFAMKAVSDKIGDLAGISAALLGLSGSLLVFAIAAKIIGGIAWGDLAKMGVALVALVGAIAIIAKCTKSLDKVNFASFGTMMMGLAAALLIFSVSIGILGRMKLGTLVQGMAAVGVFLLMTRGVMKTSRSLSGQLPKFATTMTGLGFALLVFSASVAILGSMDINTLIQGMAAVGAFLLSMIVMMASTRLLAKDMPKFATTMFGLSAGLLAMAYTVRIIGGLDTEAMVKGGIVVAAFLVMMKSMMKAASSLTKNSKNAAKVGVMFLSFAGALLIISGALAILSLISLGDLAKGIVAIGLVGGIFAGMVALTKFAKAGKGVRSTITGMTIAIGVLAVSLAALSLIDTAKLMGSMGALMGVMAAFAGLIAATKFLKVGGKELLMIFGMSAIVLALGGIIYILSGLPVDSVLPIAKALSLLIVSLSASCVLLAFVGAIGAAAFIGIGVIAALMAVIAIFAGIAIASLPSIGKKLSEFMDNLSGFLGGASKITPEMGAGVKNLAEAIAILVGANLKKAFTSIVSFGTADLSKFGKQLSKFGKGLGKFIKSISELSVSGQNGDIDWDTIYNAMDVAIKLSEFASNIPDTSGLSTKFGKKDLGEFGKQIGTFAAQLAIYLAEFGSKMLTVSDAAGKTKNVKVDWKNVGKAVDAASDLIELANKIPDTSGISTWSGKKNIGAFGKQIATFTKGLSTYLAAMGSELLTIKDEAGQIKDVSVNWDNVEKATKAAVKLAEVAATIPDTSGFGGIFGKKDLGKFGTQIANFATGLGTYLTSVGGQFTTLNSAGEVEEVSVNWENVTAATKVAKELAETAATIPDTTGWTVDTFAKKDLGAFGDQIATFATGLGTYLTAVGGQFTTLNSAGEVEGVNINWDNVTDATDIAVKLSEIANGLPTTDGLATVFAEKDIGSFGKDIGEFASHLADYIHEIGVYLPKLTGVDKKGAMKVNWKDLGEAAGTAAKLAEIANSLPTTDGLATVFAEKDLGSFGDDIAEFASGLVTFVSTVTESFSQFDIGDGIDTTLLDAVTTVATDLSSIAGTVAENSAGWAWLTGEDGLDAFGEKVAALGGSLAEFCTSVTGEGYDSAAISKAITQIKRLVGFTEVIDEDSVTNFGDFADKIKTMGKKVNDFYKSIKDVDGAKFASVANGLSAMASIKVDNADSIQSFIDSLGKVSADGVDAFVNSFKDSSPKVLAAVAAMINSARVGIVANSMGLKTAIKNMAASCASAIDSSTYYDKFKTIGKNFVQGFANGVTLNTYIARRAAAAMANEAEIAVRKQLGINSPAKVMIPIGGGVPEGFALGVDRFSYLVGNSVRSMGNEAIDRTRKVIAKVADVVNMDIDSQPTIRPVVDLSNVAASANSINSMLSMNPSVGVMSDVGKISNMMNRRQNGVNDDVVAAIKDLGNSMSGKSGDTYNFGDMTYDDGSNVANAFKSVVRAIKMEARV